MFQALWEFVNLRPVKWSSGAIVAALGIYGTFFFERNPSVVYEVVANSPVLDVKEKLGKLSIIYDRTDLAATGQNLHLVRLRIANQGASHILKSHFDEAAPLGFKMTSGKILENSVVVGDPYLLSNLRPLLQDERTVAFSPVILNAGDFFEVKTLVLTKGTEVPVIVPIGKVAGVPHIQLREPYKDSRKSTYLAEAFGGDLWIQGGRVGGYFFAGLLLLIASIASIVLPGALIGGYMTKRRRAKTVDKYRAALGRDTSLKEEFLIQGYLEQSPVYFVFRQIVRPDLEVELPHRYITTSPDGRTTTSQIVIEKHASPDFFEEELNKLESVGLIIRDGPQITINPDFDDVAKKFVNFVEPTPSARQAPSATA